MNLRAFWICVERSSWWFGEGFSFPSLQNLSRDGLDENLGARLVWQLLCQMDSSSARKEGGNFEKGPLHMYLVAADGDCFEV